MLRRESDRVARASLSWLFESLFASNEEIKRFLDFSAVGNSVALDLPAVHISRREYSSQCVDLLLRRGLTGDELFAELRSTFSRRTEDIDRVARVCSAIRPEVARRQVLADSTQSSVSPFHLTIDWIAMIGRQRARLQKERHEELEAIAGTFGPVEVLAAQYVEPDCMLDNPADIDEESPIAVFQKSMREYLNHFFAQEHHIRDGRNQLFILADGGMGKSSLLMMLKLASLASFGELPYVCLEKLDGETLDRLAVVAQRRWTVLLLDSLDEDPSAWGRVSDRLQDILQETKSFRHVVITCRTQFFPSDSGKPIEQKGRVEIGNFRCPLVYLAPFSEEKVAEYLARRYPDARPWFMRPFVKPRREGLDKIEHIVTSMKSLKTRPLLLAYADDLRDSEVEGLTSSAIFRMLVGRWLQREVREKGSLPDMSPGRSAERIQFGCELMAAYMSRYGRRQISVAELDSVVQHPGVVARIGHIDLGARSLLNKDSNGDYRFAHYSVQEFLLASAMRVGRISAMGLRLTRQTIDFLLDDGPPQPLILDGADLSGEDLSRLQLDQASFRGAILRGTRFDGASLVRANFENAIASRASFQRANLCQAKLTHALMDHAVLARSNLENVDSSKVDLSFSDLRGVSVPEVDLEAWHHSGACLASARAEGSSLAMLRSLFVERGGDAVTFTERRTGASQTFAGPRVNVGALPGWANLCIGQDAAGGVARMHAVVEVHFEGADIIDLGSESGTKVNGKRIERTCALNHGDVVWFADYAFRVTFRSQMDRDVPEPEGDKVLIDLHSLRHLERSLLSSEEKEMLRRKAAARNAGKKTTED